MRTFSNWQGGRRLVGLLGTTAMALALAACDSRGVPTAPSRPGAERAATAGGLTATAPGRQYDNDARATDETRTAPIGSTVAGRGGQRAQQEAIQREAAERDRAAREIAQREAAQREASRTGSTPPTQSAAPPPASVTTTAAPPVTTAAAPPTQPAPPPQPAPAPAPQPQQNVTVTPAAASPPPQTASATPATPPRPQDPNKAFEPPPGWVPPGRTEAVNQPQPAAPAPAQTAAAAPPRPAPAATPAPAPAPAPAPTVTTSPVAPPQADQRAPERTVSSMPAPSPAPAPPPRAVPTTTTTAATTPTRTPAAAPQPQTPPQMANLSTATSGAVPSGVTVSPPLGGPMQVAVIQFGRNSSGLSADDVRVLRSVADMHRRNGGTVRVLGHASRDVSGTSVSDIRNGNLNLSIKRAEAVSALLVRHGVPADAIVMEGVADEEPVYETRTARGVAANRRAEVFIDF